MRRVQEVSPWEAASPQQAEPLPPPRPSQASCGGVSQRQSRAVRALLLHVCTLGVVPATPGGEISHQPGSLTQPRGGSDPGPSAGKSAMEKSCGWEAVVARAAPRPCSMTGLEDVCWEQAGQDGKMLSKSTLARPQSCHMHRDKGRSEVFRPRRWG